MKPNFARLGAGALAAAALALAFPAGAQQLPPPADVLTLDASATSMVAPDMAMVTMTVDRLGPDPAAMIAEVNSVLGRALAEAKATRGVDAQTGAYTTYPRSDNKGQRTGWQVRAELIAKSRDFAALGTLAGRLSANLVIAGSGFEISPELRAAEEKKLIDQGVAAFLAKARAAATAFGYRDFTIREVSMGEARASGGPRPFVQRAASMAGAEAAPMPIESGRVALTLAVSGSVQMKH